MKSPFLFRRIPPLLLFLSFFLPSTSAGDDSERVSTLEDQQRVAVTIYNDDLALVKDSRRVTLERGMNRLAFREVSALIRPETALLRSISHPDRFSVLEQNFDFDLLTPQKLLEKYVGRRVRIVRTHPQTGEESSEDAFVLAASSGVVLRVGDRIETGIPGRIVYPDVPADLRDRPTLVTTVDCNTDRPQELELSYLTGGLSWRADYVAELDPHNEMIDLSGWITLTNRSGTTYSDASLQLVAGDIHRVFDESPRTREMIFAEAMAKAPEKKVSQESLFEYHLYSLDHPTTLRENQTKQVALLTASALPVTKEYLLRGGDYYYRGAFGELGRKLKVGVFIEFENNQEGGLGIPLPKGTVRVYKRDSQENTQFVGEDRIDHTPIDETVRLKLGDAFDVTADRTQTDFRKVAGSGRYDYVFESAYRIELRNAKEEAVTVKVVEPMPGDWDVLEENLPHVKESSGEAAWEVDVPAEGEATLEYRVRVRF